MWWNSFKIREIIFAGYSLPLFLAIAVAGIVDLEIEKFAEKNQVEVLVGEVVDNADDISWSIVVVGRSTRGYLLNQDPNTLNQLPRGVELLNNSTNRLKELVSDNFEQKNRLERVITISQQLVKFNQQLIGGWLLISGCDWGTSQ